MEDFLRPDTTAALSQRITMCEPTLHSKFDGEHLSKLDVTLDSMASGDPRCEYTVDSWRLGRVIE